MVAEPAVNEQITALELQLVTGSGWLDAEIAAGRGADERTYRQIARWCRKRQVLDDLYAALPLAVANRTEPDGQEDGRLPLWLYDLLYPAPGKSAPEELLAESAVQAAIGRARREATRLIAAATARRGGRAGEQEGSKA